MHGRGWGESWLLPLDSLYPYPQQQPPQEREQEREPPRRKRYYVPYEPIQGGYRGSRGNGSLEKRGHYGAERVDGGYSRGLGLRVSAGRDPVQCLNIVKGVF